MELVQCDKPDQVRAWINDNLQQWKFWQQVLSEESYKALGKTREQALALCNYFEGRYDMACNFRQILSN